MDSAKAVVSLVLLVALPTGVAVYTQAGPSTAGEVQECQFTTRTFDTDAVVLSGVSHVSRDGDTRYLVNVTVESAAVGRLVLRSDGTTVVNRSVTPGDYSFDLTESDVRSLEIAATAENGTVLDRAVVEYRCTEPTTVS